MEKNGVQLLIDPMSYQYLTGAEIDYTEGLEGAQFVIKNPNATSTCGCGSSFSAWKATGLGPFQFRRVDRAQHARPARAGDRRQVARQSVQRALAPARRTPSLPPVADRCRGGRSSRARQAPRVRRGGASARAFFAPPPQTIRRRAPAAMPRDGVGDAARGEFEQRRLHRLRVLAAGSIRCEPGCVEQIAAGALGRRAREIGLSQHALEQRRESTVPAGRPGAARVVAACRGAARPTGRAGSCPGRCRSRSPSPWRGRKVRLAMPPRLSATRSSAGSREYRGVERRRQRRALAAGGDVAAAEIGHHADARQFGEQRRVADLRWCSRAPAGGARSGRGSRWRGPRRAALSTWRSTLGDRGRVASRQFVAGERRALDFVRAAAY